MTIAVDLGRKATKQTYKDKQIPVHNCNKFLSIRLDLYFNMEDFLEKSLRIKSVLKSTEALLSMP